MTKKVLTFIGMKSHYDHTENSEKQVDNATSCNNSKLNQESLEESMNPEGHFNVTKLKQRARKNKKPRYLINI